MQKRRETPGWKFRQGEPKMQLRPEEQEALGLSLMGQGHFRTAPLGADGVWRVPGLRRLPFLRPQLDASFGICAPLLPP